MNVCKCIDKKRVVAEREHSQQTFAAKVKVKATVALANKAPAKMHSKALHKGNFESHNLVGFNINILWYQESLLGSTFFKETAPPESQHRVHFHY